MVKVFRMHRLGMRMQRSGARKGERNLKLEDWRVTLTLGKRQCFLRTSANIHTLSLCFYLLHSWGDTHFILNHHHPSVRSHLLVNLIHSHFPTFTSLDLIWSSMFGCFLKFSSGWIVYFVFLLSSESSRHRHTNFFYILRFLLFFSHFSFSSSIFGWAGPSYLRVQLHLVVFVVLSTTGITTLAIITTV